MLRGTQGDQSNDAVNHLITRLTDDSYCLVSNYVRSYFAFVREDFNISFLNSMSLDVGSGAFNGWVMSVGDEESVNNEPPVTPSKSKRQFCSTEVFSIDKDAQSIREHLQ